MLFAQKPAAVDECARTAGMQVYSSVLVNEETGDLLGYELAIKHDGNSGVDALLYVFEGGESGHGIPLTVRIAKNRLSLHGTWVEHLLEGSSKREIAEEHSVEIGGVLGPSTLRGVLTIADMTEHQRVRLKHVTRIWSCNNWNPSPPN
jgi:hypothetical protein